MIRIAFAGLLAFSALAFSTSSANAQCGGPVCGYPQFGCGGFCMTIGRAFHAHGPLYSYANYGQPCSGWGYGGYGNCANGHCFGLNRAPMSRGMIGGGGLFNGHSLGGLFHGRGNGCDSCGGNTHAMSIFRNVFNRIHPFAGRNCNTGCGSAASCGTACGNCSSGCK